ncbi:MAG: hypothetical protein WA177_00770, partial [Xanthobacteraceae bacterium]
AEAGTGAKAAIGAMAAATGAGAVAAVAVAVAPVVAVSSPFWSPPVLLAAFLPAGADEAGVVALLFCASISAVTTSVATAAGVAAAAGFAASVAFAGSAGFALSAVEASGSAVLGALASAVVAAVASSPAPGVAAACLARWETMAFAASPALVGLVSGVAPGLTGVALLEFGPDSAWELWAVVWVSVVEFGLPGGLAAGPAGAWLLLLFPADPFAVPGACCGACGGLAGGFAATGGFDGAEVLASSKAANGCESLSWLSADACIRNGGVSEVAAG